MVTKEHENIVSHYAIVVRKDGKDFLKKGIAFDVSYKQNIKRSNGEDYMKFSIGDFVITDMDTAKTMLAQLQEAIDRVESISKAWEVTQL